MRKTKMKSVLSIVAGAAVTATLAADVSFKEGSVVLPTYAPGGYDKTPLFYTGRVYQGAQGRFGIMPDLTTFGKIIGGGLPVGAYGGRAEIMRHIAPEGEVYQAGTLSGNPLAMAAGLATLGILRDADYAALESRVHSFVADLEEILRSKGVPAQIPHIASMFSVYFTEAPIADFASVQTTDKAVFESFYKQMREKGIFMAPSPFEANMLSFAHTDEDFARALDAARSVAF